MLSLEYEQKINDWHLDRENSLRKENGWLALAGLFWLNEGENRVGSDPSSDVVLPARAPAALGSIRLEGKRAILHTNPGQVVRVNGEEAREANLNPDVDEDPSFITLDGMRLVIIERPSGIGVRIWDNLRPERQSYPPRLWFPINEALRLPARYTRHAAPRKVLLPDVFGELVEAGMDGILTFEIEGNEHSLEVSESGDGTLDIHFQDLTNGVETYPSGRYYYTSEAPVNGQITIDFNFAYSPPCAFTEFATCSFAPAENRLKVRIDAGEMYRAGR